MRLTQAICAAILLLSGSIQGQGTLPWPVYPDSTNHQLNAKYGLYLGGIPRWMHSGLDLLAPAGTPVYAVESGYVKTITTKFDHYSYWRIVIGDSPGPDTCDAWLYAHLRQETIPMVPEGHYIEAGTYLGVLVDWPYTQGALTHLHFSRIRYAGDSLHWAVGQDDWIFIANPLDFLVPDNDADTPVFENALDDNLLAFCRNESDIYFASGAPVSGDVDIICSAYDYYNSYGLKNSPYSIEYKIDGGSSIPWTMAVCFTDAFGRYDDMENYISVVFKKDAICNSDITYDLSYQQSFFNLTNNDGDTLVEPSDKARCWQTKYFYNGDYMVHVRVKDKSGNTARDSMAVTVDNAFTVSGTVTLIGGNPDPGLTYLEIQPDDLSAQTDGTGGFEHTHVGGGYQTLSFSHSVYEPFDTTLLITGNMVVDVALTLGEHYCGDANMDMAIDVGDAVFIINYVFKGGPGTEPPCLSDANGDGMCDVGDAVFLINYVFKGGALPLESCCQD